MTEEVKGAKFLCEVHCAYPLPDSLQTECCDPRLVKDVRRAKQKECKASALEILPSRGGCSGSRLFCAPGPAVKGTSTHAPSPFCSLLRSYFFLRLLSPARGLIVRVVRTRLSQYAPRQGFWSRGYGTGEGGRGYSVLNND